MVSRFLSEATFYLLFREWNGSGGKIKSLTPSLWFHDIMYCSYSGFLVGQRGLQGCMAGEFSGFKNETFCVLDQRFQLKYGQIQPK
jgi:hypothetical protein